MSNKLLPIGIQDFEKIRNNGYLYIDKTEMIYKLATTGNYYFLSRPRRFGKSLLISTIKAYFQGKKELFNGLAIENLEQKWMVHPVLHLDLNAKKYDESDSLNSILNQHLEKWEAIYGDEKKSRSPEERFSFIIEKCKEKTGKNVVVLIDEYDKPLLQAIGNDDLQTEYRNTLKAFYGVLKSSDKYIQFALLTGVTKFSKVSVFSDLNNLQDISTDSRYSNICGITQRELDDNFNDEINELAAVNNLTINDTRQKLKEWYDGYHFIDNSENIYNPFSILNTFAKMRFGSYWFETGTPTFLVELLKNCNFHLPDLSEVMASVDSLGGIDAIDENPIPVLYQSGYLTIKDFNAEFNTFILGFPNREVEDGFTRFLIPFYTNVQRQDSPMTIVKLVQDIRAAKIDDFMTRLKSFFADTPYEMIRDLELHYQNVMYIVFKLLGFYTQAEYHTANGRIDLLVKTDKYIYIMEFKLNGTAEEALKQINEKYYEMPFEADQRTVFKIGANFCNKTRQLEKWIVEQ